MSDPYAHKGLRKFRIIPRTKNFFSPQETVTFGTRTPLFTCIDEAEKVFHLMHDIQKETA